MQNENQTVMPPANPAAAPQPVAAEAVKKWRNPYETFLLLFGCAAVFSLLTGNGALLKVAAAIFLIMGLMAIAKGIPLRGEQVQPRTYTDEHGITYKAKRPWTPLRVLGLTLLIVILVPVVGYLALILFFILAFTVGGAEMGT